MTQQRNGSDPKRKRGRRHAADVDNRDVRSAVTTYTKLVGKEPALISLDLAELRAMRTVLMRAFGRPRGVLGTLGGMIMAHANAGCGAWVTDLLDVGANDRVLEVGFGAGVIIQRLTELAATGHVAGIDPSRNMLRQARARNTNAMRSGRVDLQLGSVDSMPFADDSFDKALSINSMQVWPDPVVGLREIRRVIRPAGRIALGFTSHSGQRPEKLSETVVAAGFTDPCAAARDDWFCVLATRPCGP
jgi:SAM-dependent methyltransferase